MSKYKFDSEAFRAKRKQERIDNVYACIESAFVRFEQFKKGAWTGKFDIFLFGSVARNEAIAFSDTDVLLLYTTKTGNFDDVKYIFDLELRDNECDLVCYEQADFVSRQNNNPSLFIRNITKDMQYLKSYEVY